MVETITFNAVLIVMIVIKDVERGNIYQSHFNNNNKHNYDDIIINKSYFNI